MDPASIVGLVGTCAGIAAKAVSVAKDIDDFVQGYRSADKSVARLAASLRRFEAAIQQLGRLLNSSPALDDGFKQEIKSSLEDCTVILEDLSDRVQGITSGAAIPSMPKSLSFSSKFKLLWNQGSLAEEESRLERSLQTVMLFVGIARLDGGAPKQATALQQPAARKTLAESAQDARSIRTDKKSIMSSTASTLRDSENISVQLSIDEEILKSGPYVEHYRKLVLRSMAKDNGHQPVSEEPTPVSEEPTPVREEPTPFKDELTPVKEELRRKPIPRKPIPQALVSELHLVPRPGLGSGRGRPTYSVSSLIEVPALTRKPTHDLQEVTADDALPAVRPSSSAKPAELEAARATTPEPIPMQDDVEPQPQQFATSLVNLSTCVPPQGLGDYLKCAVTPLAKPGLWLDPSDGRPLFSHCIDEPQEESNDPSRSEVEDVADLCRACEDGNVKWAQYVLREGAAAGDVRPWNVDQYFANDPSRRTPLHLAVINGHLEVIRLLIDEANLEVRDGNGCSALMLAIDQVVKHGSSLDITRQLLDAGANAGVRTSPTFLAAAVATGNLELVELLLEYGARTEDEGEEPYQSPVAIAVASDRPDILKVLLEHECPTDTVDVHGRSPLLVAVMKGNAEMVRVLVGHDELTDDADFQGFRPLSYAVRRVLVEGDNLEIVQLLVPISYRFPGPDDPDDFPLILSAVSMGHVKLAQNLLELYNYHNEEDDILPLHLAIDNGDVPMASVLVEADNTAPTHSGRNKFLSPLVIAIMKDNADMIQQLLHPKLSLESLEDGQGLGALTTAALVGNFDLLQRLLNRQCDDICCMVPITSVPTPHRDINTPVTLTSYSALHIVARCSLECPRRALAMLRHMHHDDREIPAGCSVSFGTGDGTDVKNVTCLHLAVGACGRYLIEEMDANVFAKDDQGRTPLFWAATELAFGDLAKTENAAAVLANIEHGSPVNLRDAQGRTPLIAVAEKIDLCMKVMIGRQASPPNIWRVLRADLDALVKIYRLLLKAGADADIGDKKGRTPRTIVYGAKGKWRGTTFSEELGVMRML